MTTPLTKLIEENKERPIAEAPKDGTHLFAKVDGAMRLVTYGKTSHVPLYGWILIDQGAEDADLCEPTHFRPLPDDRLALVAELYDQFIKQLSTADAAKTILDWPALAQNIRKKAEEIAEGKK